MANTFSQIYSQLVFEQRFLGGSYGAWEPGKCIAIDRQARWAFQAAGQ